MEPDIDDDKNESRGNKANADTWSSSSESSSEDKEEEGSSRLPFNRCSLSAATAPTLSCALSSSSSSSSSSLSSSSSSAAINAETYNDDDEHEEEEEEESLEEESVATLSPAMIALPPPATAAAGHVSAHGSTAAVESPPMPFSAILSTVVLEGRTFAELSPEEMGFIRERRLLAAGTLL
jgi:hypothetical protein